MTRTELPKQAVVIGRLVGMDESYSRTVGVPRGLVMGILWAGALFRLVLAAFRVGAGGQRWKDVRNGPEYLVTPVRVRDSRGDLFALEIHGYLSANALHIGDEVRVRLRRQSDGDLPPLGYHIANLTSGQILEPRRPTLWSHLGPAAVLQALLGLVLVVLVLTLVTWGLLS